MSQARKSGLSRMNVPHTIVCQEPQTSLPQLFTDLTLNSARDADAVKGSVGSFDTVEFPALAFFQKVLAVLGLGSHELGDGGERGPGFFCFLTREESVSSISTDPLKKLHGLGKDVRKRGIVGRTVLFHPGEAL